MSNTIGLGGRLGDCQKRAAEAQTERRYQITLVTVLVTYIHLSSWYPRETH